MVEIRLVKHSQEKEQLLDLFQASFGRDMPSEFWDWKYIHNPFASPDPEVIVALDNGRIVGARPFRFTEMWLGNDKVRVAQHTDTMVHPEFQGKGIFNQMGQFSIRYLEQNCYALSYGLPNPKSRPGFLKQGYRIVVPLEYMFRPINSQKLISYKLGNTALGTGLAFFYDKLLNRKVTEISQPPTSFKVEVLDQFNNELKDIDTLRNKSLIDLVRSESYLRWFFDQRPNRNYKYIVAKRANALCGYTVFSVQKQHNGLIYGYVVDHLVKDRDLDCFRTLISMSLHELQDSECDIAMIWTHGEPVFKNQLLKHFGFKSTLMFPYNMFSGHGYLDAIGIGEQAATGINVYDKDNWRVTYAYSDTI